ncbi:hypothetical protein LPJ78_005372 [Coemansia sp. RSA 989]|nr:hypothetical protein BX667DRAFT_514429 [Coemansia mojavensis]KAJ1739355.1 hypothetical protein LPJ68_004755 [Coemansia sp. RSA 1086]KAJ1747363.1 hypothetical protein LPJ79_005300 [Coemansia sp. RSA 1821]KAJ1861373.1 hypothetical protein LPJ78_005372 [Coemansia sp. RSA 989]KAJ1871851.1 hypothetical protein LPJ55_003545 [Coemansia sp. RSA 990]KAJ2651276.1 hypothetical protein IWW40_001767 [Coemansia sp. RSA 1250]KAJ2673745.1 hypothetical protein IWW42_002157 [Coemansia sp. RSA 1085]
MSVQSRQTSPAPHRQSAAERCWICLEELKKNRKEWLYPCMCSLVCHEECLLHWISESERRVRSGVVRCPQCNTPYKVIQWKSAAFNVLDTIYSAVDKTLPFFLATIGSMAVVVACTAYGAYTVMTVYGAAEGRRILGAVGKWDHSKWVWLPIIPMTLIGSRFQIGAAYMPLSTLLMTVPQPLRIHWPPPPSLTLSALPTISALYRYFWSLSLGRLERRWESHLPPEQGTLTIRGFGLRNDAENNDNLEDANIAGWPAALAGREGNDAANQVRDQEQQGRPGHNFEATIVLNGASLGRTLVESLLLPVISSAFGSVIGKLPFMRRPGLSHFSRTVLGGCAYFVIKDLIRTLYKYLLYRSRSSRHVEGRKRY